VVVPGLADVVPELADVPPPLVWAPQAASARVRSRTGALKRVRPVGGRAVLDGQKTMFDLVRADVRRAFMAPDPTRTFSHGTLLLWTFGPGTYVVGPVMPTPPVSKAAAQFGARVRTRRNALGLSQEALADKAGVHWTFLGQVERGRRNLTLHNILKLAAGLGVDPGALVEGLKAPK
jgi:DNA-binding XRE family transcriptional regulator